MVVRRGVKMADKYIKGWWKERKVIDVIAKKNNLRVGNLVVCVQANLEIDGIGFFFSSRRRHTRLQGDWSSDVCSSDLIPAPTTTISVKANSTMTTAPRAVSD